LPFQRLNVLPFSGLFNQVPNEILLKFLSCSGSLDDVHLYAAGSRYPGRQLQFGSVHAYKQLLSVVVNKDYDYKAGLIYITKVIITKSDLVTDLNLRETNKDSFTAILAIHCRVS